eukprot:TRINITY_DN4279_c2_g1_i1.p1 TRINITY_DN4279_c2_g1~~TRINITY_DN4279_c2_g1_i1.p1  ORF type:complete len:157 (+),score=23.57 TRINITY_DN4279_c2_g1_i1:185-655(+)
MLTVSSAPREESQNELLEKLAKLEPIDTFMPNRQAQGKGKGIETSSVHVLEPDDLIDLSASFQTHTRQCSVHLLNGTYSIAQDMRDSRQLCESLEKRVSAANTSLAKLHSDLSGVSKLEKAIEASQISATKCMARIENINELLALGAQAAASNDKE